MRNPKAKGAAVGVVAGILALSAIALRDNPSGNPGTPDVAPVRRTAQRARESGVDPLIMARREIVFTSLMARRAIDGMLIDDESVEKTVENLRVGARIRQIIFWFGADESTGARLDDLSAFPELEVLLISGPGLTDDFSQRIGQMPDLWLLRLTDAPISAKGLRSLDTLPKLVSLGLQNTLVDDEAVKILVKLPMLTSLSLHGTEVTDNGIKFLTRLPRLKYLDVDGCRITDSSVESLSRLKSLRELKIHDCDFSPAGLRRLRAALPDTEIEDSPSVRTEWMTDEFAYEYAKNRMCFALTERGLARFISAHPETKVLNFYAYTGMTDQCVEALVALRQLEEVRFYKDVISDKALITLAGIPSLKRLVIDHCFNITPEGTERFRTMRPDVYLHVRSDHLSEFHYPPKAFEF